MRRQTRRQYAGRHADGHTMVHGRETETFRDRDRERERDGYSDSGLLDLIVLSSKKKEAQPGATMAHIIGRKYHYVE